MVCITCASTDISIKDVLNLLGCRTGILLQETTTQEREREGGREGGNHSYPLTIGHVITVLKSLCLSL